MKKYLFILSFFSGFLTIGQVPAYYSSIDFSLTGNALKAELSDLITTTHIFSTSYSDVWDILKESDLDPSSSSRVLLMYGYNDADGNVITDRTRNKNNNGGAVGEWNREHVFPKSLGVPNLGTSGPGSDPHNLRASDVQMNGNRSNRKFANGSGNAGTAGSNWYPGDEWKGDAARIIMYMYLRYGNRCLPSAVAVGSTNAMDANMINLLLDWNASDDVSQLEENRNDIIEDATGNRNPFIDNPALATQIWGGTQAEDTWGVLSTFESAVAIQFSVYPNPAQHGDFVVRLPQNQFISTITLRDLQGRLIDEFVPAYNQLTYPVHVSGINHGLIMVTVTGETTSTTQKIVLQ